MTRSSILRTLVLATGGLGLALALACSAKSPTAPEQRPGPPITLGDPLVVAAFTAEPSDADPFTLTFTNLSLGATTYLWEFGDRERSREVNPIHTYEEPGTYLVRLTASNDTFSDVAEQFVAVGGLPVANFNPIIAGLDVFFDNTSENATSFTWDFGDGTGSTEEEPSHTYRAFGSYLVVLEACNELGCDSFGFELTLEPPAPPGG